MLHVQVDEEAIKNLYQVEINKRLEELDQELVFWDSKELKRRTCLSWNTIQDSFFHDKRFPKVKVGSKWLFPAKEAEVFLVEWLKEKRGESE